MRKPYFREIADWPVLYCRVCRDEIDSGSVCRQCANFARVELEADKETRTMGLRSKIAVVLVIMGFLAVLGFAANSVLADPPDDQPANPWTYTCVSAVEGDEDPDTRVPKVLREDQMIDLGVPYETWPHPNKPIIGVDVWPCRDGIGAFD